jgi:uncharacterized coiled-coil protein SlyX
MAANGSYRRIGEILVGRGLITMDQLAIALAEQRECGRPLGEICVERFGLDRLGLADALAEQWDEMQRASGPTVPAAPAVVDAPPVSDDTTPEDELRVLLEEAHSARAELESKTDELGRRLAALEALVVGVNDALAELRAAPAPARKSTTRAGATGSRTKRRPAGSVANASA